MGTSRPDVSLEGAYCQGDSASVTRRHVQSLPARATTIASRSSVPSALTGVYALSAIVARPLASVFTDVITRSALRTDTVAPATGDPSDRRVTHTTLPNRLIFALIPRSVTASTRVSNDFRAPVSC